MSIESYLKDMQKQLMIKNEKILKTEAKRLKNCIQNQIDNYYESYTPVVGGYDRTNRFKTSLYVEDIINLNIISNRIEIKLAFNPDLAWHDSLFSDEGAYVPLLINNGWSWDEIITPNDHFSNYKGFHYIERGIKDFNRTNPYGIHVEFVNEWE